MLAAAAWTWALPAVALGAAGLALGLRSWRASLYALLAYIPLSGIPIIAAFGDRGERAVAVLAKDFLFVVPAYVGFALWARRRRVRPAYPGVPLVVLALFAALVLAEALNPSLPSFTVALIGIKVWLFYVPLVFLGYHLVETRRDLFLLLGVLGVTAVVPAVIGLVEAGLVYAGHAALVWDAYGKAAFAVTQNFTTFVLPGGGELHRIPSTFSYVVQYYSFVVAMVALVYGWWRAGEGGRRAQVLALGVWLLLVAAAFTSGQRGAFLVVPLLIVFIVALESRYGSLRAGVRALAPILAAAVLFLVAVSAAGATVSGVTQHTWKTTQLEFRDLVLDGFRNAADRTWIGLGSGMDTNASRYAYASEHQFQAVGGHWYEGWYVKAWLELGIAGLVLVALIFGFILWRGFREHFRLRDPRLRVVSAAILGLVIFAAVYNFKGQYLDFDPLNVYFWLFAGVLAKLPALDRRAE